MGYRHYFYQVESKTLNAIRNSNKEQFIQIGRGLGILDEDDNDPYVPLYKIGKELFGFGKYYENAAEIEKLGKPLFKDKELAEKYDDYGAFIVGKEAILSAIEWQRKKIIEIYEYMLFCTEQERTEKYFDERTQQNMWKEHIKEMWTEWSGKTQFLDGKTFEISKDGFAINTDLKNPIITTSWKYEYSIFELIRVYKTTNWKKYKILFMGW